MESNLTHTNRQVELEICVVGKYALSSDQTCTVSSVNFCIFYSSLCVCAHNCHSSSDLNDTYEEQYMYGTFLDH